VPIPHLTSCQGGLATLFGQTRAALAKVEIEVDIPEGASAQMKLEIKK